MMSGSAELCSDESKYNMRCMVMHRSGAFEDLMRNATMNASLQRSMEEDVSGCGEHVQLLLESRFTSQYALEHKRILQNGLLPTTAKLL